MMKSELPKKLDKIGEKIQELLINLEEFKKKMKKFTQNQMNSYDNTIKYSQKLADDNIYEKSNIKYIHNIIEDWIADNSFATYI